jgi:phosphoglycolate phosphatase-like HAD superfamily hydrolase
LIRNIIWDLDGTIFDTWPANSRAYYNTITSLGEMASYRWIKDELCLLPYQYRFSTLAEKYWLDVDAVKREFKSEYTKIPANDCPPFIGVESVLRHINSINGVNVIVTNRERQGAERFLTAYNMMDYFVTVISNDDGYPSKPDPTAFKVVIEHFDLNLPDTICIGDSATDIIAGQAVGLFSCMFGNSSHHVKPDLYSQMWA